MQLIQAVALLALVAVGCMPTMEPTESTQPPEPSLIGEPLPGSFYLFSDPALAPYPMTIRSGTVGGQSGRNEVFREGEVVVIDWTDLPLPQQKWIVVNDQDCDGTFTVQARMETDLLLDLIGETCRVVVLGRHPEDAPHPFNRPVQTST